MRTVITYGTFDLFHIGHVRILERLYKLGDRLIVGVSSDEFNSIKGKKSFFSYEERAKIVSSSKYVDFVFPEHSWDQKYNDIIKYKADILGMGNDWLGKFDYLNNICEIVYLDRTENISTTDIKASLSLISPEQLTELENSVISVLNILRNISSNYK